MTETKIFVLLTTENQHLLRVGVNVSIMITPELPKLKEFPSKQGRIPAIHG